MRQRVWINRRKLKGTGIFLNESFAAEVREVRSKLWPYVKSARKVGKKATLMVDTLRIDGKKYKIDEIASIPEIYKPSHTKTIGDVLYFTKHSPLSNHYECSFTIDDTEYTSAEQYFAAQTSRFFDDKEMTEQIMSQKSAAEHKRSIRKIKGYNKATWYEDHALKAMKEAMVAKFTQNEELGQFLKNTGTKDIAEANPSDYHWGIGLSLWSNDAHDKALWNGHNHAGQLLMDIRSTL
jgi:ribA/ribD-fused uncharacterized protein